MPPVSPERPFDLDRIGRGLPMRDTIAGLGDALATGAAVVEAPPGTGKTTLVPPALYNLTRADTPGRIVVTTPRRVSVRAAARRLAALDGTPLGQRVGYSIRGEHHPATAVEFCTPGVLLQRLLRDPELPGVSGVILDEVHERQLDTDLTLGIVGEVRQLREDLRVVVMSATLDSARWAELLDARVLSTPAVTHPLTYEYAPAAGRLQGTREFLDHLAHQAATAVDARGESALVFVPGVREVEHVVARLGALGHEALPLHGRLDSAAQDRALRPSGTPRIVVATSIAETSLTVPGVRIVVDSGLSRVPRRDARGMTGLVTLSAARATVEQRAGRAGREGPGHVIRAYTESELQHFASAPAPEIATSDLTQASLQMAAWGTPRGEGLPLPDPAPAGALADAHLTLHDLGAVHADGTITDTGRRLVTLPVDPRAGAALLRYGAGAATTVAALSDSPRGDLAAWQPPAREVRRLARLVPDRGPVSPGLVVATAFPRWVGEVRGEEVHLVSGTHPLSLGIGGGWVAVSEVSRTPRGTVVRAYAHLSFDEVQEAVGHLVTSETTAFVEGGRVRARRVKRLGAIELSATPVPAPPEAAADAVRAALREEGMGLFAASASVKGLVARLSFLHARLGEPWPDPAAADPEVFLGPELEAIAKGLPLAKVDLLPAVQRLLPWPEAARLEELAPERWLAPSGNRHRVDYSSGKPVVALKLQETFGLAESPRLAGVPIVFHLLSPAGRPLAITDDLASFWSGAYGGVRAEMRGRYPKHPWPEDPWAAQATAKTTRALRRER